MKRKIVEIKKSREEHATLTKSTYRRWSIEVHTVHLECGHKKVYRGDSCPVSFVNCKPCAAASKTLVTEHFSDKAMLRQAAKSGVQ